VTTNKVLDTEQAPLTLFQKVCKAKKLPVPETEYRLTPARRWRLDYAWPVYKVALEVEGGVWVKGRHNRGGGFLKDMEKYNHATTQGWRLLRCTPDTLLSTETLDLVRATIDCAVTQKSEAV
jgi:hypothetical protein